MTEKKYSRQNPPWACKPFIIADIGSNWCLSENQDENFKTAIECIERAAGSGADAVKFQYYTHEELYGFAGDNKYSLPREWLPKLKEKCLELNVEFMCSAFSAAGVHQVDPWVNIHKLASSEMLDVSIIDAIKKTGKPWIVSSGGAHISEIHILAELYEPDVVMECVAKYPADEKDYNLYWYNFTERRFVLGLSDHTYGDRLATIAAWSGAMVFEKHFKVDWDTSGSTWWGRTPDWGFSRSHIDFHSYTHAIHQAFAVRMNTEQKVGGRECEKEMALKWRRRIKATRDIKAGEILQRDVNYGFYRSKTDDTVASAPPSWVYIEGKPAVQDYKAFDGIYAGPYADK